LGEKTPIKTSLCAGHTTLKKAGFHLEKALFHMKGALFRPENISICRLTNQTTWTRPSPPVPKVRLAGKSMYSPEKISSQKNPLSLPDALGNNEVLLPGGAVGMGGGRGRGAGGKRPKDDTAVMKTLRKEVWLWLWPCLRLCLCLRLRLCLCLRLRLRLRGYIGSFVDMRAYSYE